MLFYDDKKSVQTFTILHKLKFPDMRMISKITSIIDYFVQSSDLTLTMASAQVVETSIANNSTSRDSNHPDDLFQSRYVTPGFKPFS